MSMSTHVMGFKPPDDKFRKMLAAWQACEAAGVDPPDEVTGFFEGEEPDEAGVPVDLYDWVKGERAYANGVDEWSECDSSGYEVDLTKLDPDVKILRFYNSW